jgi:hypothetical protein
MKLAGISTRIAQAVFSGVRIDAATSLISRILAATNASPTTKEEL